MKEKKSAPRTILKGYSQISEEAEIKKLVHDQAKKEKTSPSRLQRQIY